MYISMLLFLFIFIYSLLGMQIYGGNLPNEKTGIRQNYDSILFAFLSSFQIVTMENWNDILMVTMSSGVSKGLTIVYLVSWIFIGNFIFLNLFLAILLDGFENEDDEVEEPDEEEDFGASFFNNSEL